MQRLTPWWRVRLYAFALVLLAVGAALSAVVVDPFETALAYLVILAIVVALGLVSNALGGLLAAGVGVLANVLLSQYAGIYPRENPLLNLGTQAALSLLVGLAAGSLADSVQRMERDAAAWQARAEQLAVHDETFDTLKPKWARVRLDEEMHRAAQFGRPLSVMMLQFDAKSGVTVRDRGERVAVLQALIRAVRSVAPPPAVVSHLGGKQVLAIMPEQTLDAATSTLACLRARLAEEVYFSPSDPIGTLGKSIRECGWLSIGVIACKPAETPAEALERLQASLIEEDGCSS